MSAPRGQAARHRIIGATREILLDGGLDAFTVEAVANASGAARSTIYRHWPDPQDLAVETLTSMGRDFPVPDTGSLKTDLEQVVAMIRPILDDPRTRRLLLDVTRAAAADAELERIRQQAIGERRQPLQGILQRAIARGEIDPDIDMTVAMHLVEGPLMSATVLQNLPISDEMISTLVERIVKSLT
jgi:AcrR family transcriptional regulator